AASDLDLTTRAKNSHLSIRCLAPVSAIILLLHLLFQSKKLGERRIGIDACRTFLLHTFTALMTVFTLRLTLIATTEVTLGAFALAFAVMTLLLVEALATAIITRLLVCTTFRFACFTALITVLMTAILVAAILTLTVLVLIAVAAFETTLTPQKNRLWLFSRRFCGFAC